MDIYSTYRDSASIPGVPLTHSLQREQPLPQEAAAKEERVGLFEPGIGVDSVGCRLEPSGGVQLHIRFFLKRIRKLFWTRSLEPYLNMTTKVKALSLHRHSMILLGYFEGCSQGRSNQRHSNQGHSD
jgi:hypothetical protein